MSQYKYKLVESPLFKKTRKLAVKRGLNITLLQDVIILLAKGEPLPAKYRDHPLKDKYTGFRECHIRGDWLLVYRIFEDKLILSLHSTGSHADLF